MLERLRDFSDRDAWNRFVDIYGPLIFSWCRRWKLQAHDTQDIAQDVFSAVAGHISNFQRSNENATFRGWLWTITKNTALKHFEARARNPRTVSDIDPLQRLHDAPDQYPDEREGSVTFGDTARLMHRTLEVIRHDFSERTWAAFWRLSVERQRSSEIAADLGMTQRAVR